MRDEVCRENWTLLCLEPQDFNWGQSPRNEDKFSYKPVVIIQNSKELDKVSEDLQKNNVFLKSD